MSVSKAEPGDRARSLDHRRYAMVVVTLAAVYVLTGRLGLSLAHLHASATLIWPPTGLSIAALVLFGGRVWPGVFVGAAITNMMVSASAVAVVGISVGNTLEAVIAAALLVRVGRFDPGFARLRDVIGFLVFGALLATSVSATIGVASLYLGGLLDARSWDDVWLVWWLGDAGGATVFSPLVLVGVRGRPAWAEMLRRSETWIAFTLLTGLAVLGFSGVIPGATEALLPALLLFPILVWVGIRLGPRGATIASFLVGIVAVVGTAHELGPFVTADDSESLFLLWAYTSTLGAVAMILAAAVAEREDAELARRRGEEERARLDSQIRHAQRLESLAKLAGGVAHDFNNLLVPIRGNAELLKLADYPADKRVAMLDAIEVAAVHAAKLCRQLLSYAGHDRLDKRRIELAAIVDEMTPLLRSSIPRTIDLQIRRAAEPWIEGDVGQLGQVLMNLVLNATESIAAADGWVRVSVGVRDVDQATLARTFLHSDAPSGRYAVLEVSDNGCGMTQETLERIFDPFFSTKKRGRGLGMASVLGIVTAHAGSIKVRSRPGEGTTFEILLPLAEAGGAVERPSASPSRRSRVRATVLVADDEEPVRALTCRMLAGAGYEILEARDGVEAVEVFWANRDRVDVLVFDVSMPRLSGVDAVAKIRELAPNMPAVLVSGYDEGRVDSSVAAAFLQKPFRMQALLDLVAERLPSSTNESKSRTG